MISNKSYKNILGNISVWNLNILLYCMNTLYLYVGVYINIDILLYLLKIILLFILYNTSLIQIW